MVIRKLGILDYLKPEAYRVILLINCIPKVIEKVVTIRVTRGLEESGKLYKRQKNFRGKKSIMDI